ncbi:hypothetical protein PGT21_006962 [Puccinia graminis f. sp. tritici]|uniref:Expansin-like EG45 domain-containing protein n=1 Tax=Puccinia graminis f. sp. tritici TaxID=56615 RepID=A0A5B0PPG3_PUCGR|nr:hypothetical protein PGTUg99_004311 [Puccinia graminis f. sp. tritici]KAA1103121.1 hypothetical protein PGT21_006962 [Puccinia graminis f. sp. tritici]
MSASIKSRRYVGLFCLISIPSLITLFSGIFPCTTTSIQLTRKMHTRQQFLAVFIQMAIAQVLGLDPYSGQVFRGQATTDGAPWERGNCLFFFWPQPKGINPIAINSNMWDSSRMCGACIAITNEFGTHLAVVTDQSTVGPTDLDLGKDSWDEVSNHHISSGIPISWKMVPCNFTTPIQFTNQKGAHPFWTAIQVANSNLPIKSLEALPLDNKSRGWVKLKRNSASNHFGTKCKPIGRSADLRVTCMNGKQFITKNVNLVYSEGQPPTMAAGNC